MRVRLGELLVRRGVLTEPQVEAVLERQRESGRPFGVICERLHGVDPEQIELAWAEQYALLGETVDPADETFDSSVADMITRRQAWQFRVAPVRFDNGELRVLTTVKHLRRALNFSIRVLGVPAYYVLAESDRLGHTLCRYYPLGGMTPHSIDDEQIDRLLEMRRTG